MILLNLFVGKLTMAAKKNSKCKLWTEVSREAVLNSVHHKNRGLRETARLYKYNIPIEALRRHASGSVEARCKPGPSITLTDEEEDRLASSNGRHGVWS